MIRRKTLLAIVLTLLGAVVGLGIGYFAGLSLKHSHLSREQEIWLLVAMLLALPLPIAVHELGHVIGGWISGFRFQLYIVGPLKIAREEGRIRVGLNSSLGLAGGLAACLPVNDKDLRNGMLRMVLGGPVASLVLAGAGFAAMLAVSQTVAHTVLLLVAFISLLVGIATGIPSTIGHFNSDGARVLMLLRGGAEADRWCAVAALQARSMAGERPREWPCALIEILRGQDANSFDGVGAAVTLYQHFYDAGDREEAGVWIDRAVAAVEFWPKAFRPAIFVEAAYYDAAVRRNVQRAKTLFAETKGSPFTGKVAPLRVEAALLAAEGRILEARQARAQAVAESKEKTGVSKAELCWLDSLFAV